MKQLGDNSQAPKQRFAQRIHERLNKNLVTAVSVATVVSAALMGLTAWNTLSIYQKFTDSLEKSIKLNQLSDQVIYYDEVLTMSARMAATTGNLVWEDRYQSFDPKLTQAIQEILNLAPEYQENFTKVNEANTNLVEMELQAFNLVRQNQEDQALRVLLGPNYSEQKQIYNETLKVANDQIAKLLAQDIEESKRRLIQSSVLAGISIPVILLAGLAVLSLFRSYLRERNQAQADMEILNENLENRVKERTLDLAVKEEGTRKANELLQEDVANILDVVAAVEAGDLTVQAPVSEGVTGLVADTFNRLTEELTSVLSQVLKSAAKVSQESQNLELAAEDVNKNAEQQAERLNKLLELSEEILTTAFDSANQIITARQSTEVATLALDEGQEAIANLTKSINVLKESTQRIIQQMKTLGEFVGQTDQFVQDQSQIVSLTQVLAMNASLVAARASEQRDPTQFVVVAREFEAIANQVGGLAQRTNEGLGRLEQRSTQIHNVVSTVDEKVQNLGELVREFTEGVEKSSSIFGNIQSVTKEAARSSEVVEQFNQKIVNTSVLMTQVMEEIANLARQTVSLSQRAINQSQELESLSENLLKNVEFFQLPQLPAASNESTIEVN